MNIRELEQKYNNLEQRLSKVEDCLRDANRRGEELHKGIVWLKKENSKFRKETLS
jgi:chromosome segregation ATPase